MRDFDDDGKFIWPEPVPGDHDYAVLSDRQAVRIAEKLINESDGERGDAILRARPGSQGLPQGYGDPRRA